jgi:kynurenine formamidase
MRFVDLCRPIQTQMPVFPSVLKTFVGVYRGHSESLRPGGVSSQTNIIIMSDHAGTHVDAPIHFSPNGKTIDKMPLDLMFGEAVLLDFSDKKSGDSVMAEEVEKRLSNAKINPGHLKAILFKTGAAPLYGTDAYFKHYLEIHHETVRWMARQGIRLWGVDASTIDHAHNRATHMLLRELEFYHMENLANLDTLPVNFPFTLACVSLPFVGATASPLRPLAILKD